MNILLWQDGIFSPQILIQLLPRIQIIQRQKGHDTFNLKLGNFSKFVVIYIFWRLHVIQVMDRHADSGWRRGLRWWDDASAARRWERHQVCLRPIFFHFFHQSHPLPTVTAIPDFLVTRTINAAQYLPWSTRTPYVSESSSFSYVTFPPFLFHQIILFAYPLCFFILISYFPNSKSVYVVILLQSNVYLRF